MYALEGELGIEKWSIALNTDIHSAHATGDLNEDGCIDIVGGGFPYEGGQVNRLYVLTWECPLGSQEDKDMPDDTFETEIKARNIDIRFSMLKSGRVVISIYNIAGIIVKKQDLGVLGEFTEPLLQ